MALNLLCCCHTRKVAMLTVAQLQRCYSKKRNVRADPFSLIELNTHAERPAIGWGKVQNIAPCSGAPETYKR